MAGERQGALRHNQRERTRGVLLAAATELLRRGKRPTVAEAAEAARVSRRTAYRYFPSQEQLLTEAALESLRPAIQSSFESVEGDPEARLDAAIRAIALQAAENEELLRTMIRLTIERRGESAADRDKPVRGTRRIDWIERALAPVRPELSQRTFARLVSAIALCVGPEALIVLRDVRGLDPASAADISSWAARALLRTSLAERAEARGAARSVKATGSGKRKPT